MIQSTFSSHTHMKVMFSVVFVSLLLRGTSHVGTADLLKLVHLGPGTPDLFTLWLSSVSKPRFCHLKLSLAWNSTIFVHSKQRSLPSKYYNLKPKWCSVRVNWIDLLAPVISGLALAYIFLRKGILSMKSLNYILSKINMVRCNFSLIVSMKLSAKSSSIYHWYIFRFLVLC